MDNCCEVVAGCNINIRAGGYVLNNLAEIDQIGRIDNVSGNSR